MKRESVVYRIVEKLAEKKNTDVDEIEPLNNSIDAQALEDIFSRRDTHIQVEFFHNNQRVVVQKENDLTIQII